MNNKILKIINPILFILFMGTVLAVILYKVPGKLQYSELLGELHMWFGTAFIILALFHVYLNWSWIKLNIFKIKKRK